MLPTNRVATHPGEMLQELFLDEMGITQVALAAHTGMSLQRVNEIIKGKRGVTADTAWLLAQALATSPEFWMNAQANYELTKHRPAKKLRPIKMRAA
jgi:addiction module HigA family antidote